MSERWFKATRPDGTDFYSGTVDYAAALETGQPVTVDEPGGEFPGKGWLHASPVPTDCVGMQWPCRLFVVDPVGETTTDGRKYGAHGLRVIEERPVHEALGPQGEQVAAIIDRAARLTETESRELDAAWNAAWIPAWDAALATLVSDLISEDHYATLMQPWLAVIGDQS